MKKVARYLIVLGMALMTMIMVKMEDVQETTFENITVYTVDDMTDFDQTIGLSWQKQWSRSQVRTEQK